MSATTSDPGKNAVYAMKNGAVRVSRGGMRPTSASCNITNEFGDQVMVGKCHRSEWYRINGVDKTDPPNDRSFGIFVLGMEWRTTFSNYGKVKEFYWLET